MSGHDGGSRWSAGRKRLRDGLTSAKHAVDEAAGRDDGVGQLARGAKRSAAATSGVARAAGDKVEQGVGKFAGNLTLEDYRHAVDAALAEAVEVLAAQEAHLAALEARMDVLEGRSGRSDG